MRIRSFIHGSSLAAFMLLLLSGCGNFARSPHRNIAPASSWLLPPAPEVHLNQLSGFPVVGDFHCPSEANVVPEDDNYFDGTNKYAACISGANASRILLAPESTTESSKILSVCAFPISYFDTSHIFTKPDLKTGLPLFVCSSHTQEGYYVTFEKMKFNALFVTDEENVLSLQRCLAEWNFIDCKDYSFGIIR